MVFWVETRCGLVHRHKHGAGEAQYVHCPTTHWTPVFDPRQKQRIFTVISVQKALGPTQPPVQRVLGGAFMGVKRGRGVTLIIHPILWRGQE
jgi:hypothetical protein